MATFTSDKFISDWKDAKTVKTFEKFFEWSEIANKFDKLLIAQRGYAVDLACGKITRNHDDLDLIVKEKDLSWFKKRLKVDGYKIKVQEGNNTRLSFCAYKYNFLLEDSIYIDFEGINIDDKVWDRQDGKKCVWPVTPRELFVETKIQNVFVKYLNSKLVYQFKKNQQKKGWVNRDKEEHDFKMLKSLEN